MGSVLHGRIFRDDCHVGSRCDGVSWWMDAAWSDRHFLLRIVRPHLKPDSAHLLQHHRFRGQDNAADLRVYVVPMDVAALSLRSVDGARVEVDDTGGTC